MINKTVKDYEMSGGYLVISFTDGTWGYFYTDYCSDGTSGIFYADYCSDGKSGISYIDCCGDNSDKAESACSKFTPLEIYDIFNISLQRLNEMGIISKDEIDKVKTEVEKRKRENDMHYENKERKEYERLKAKFEVK